MSLVNLLKEREKNKKHFTWNGVEVWVKDPLVNPEISISSVLLSIDKKLPKHFYQNVDSIYVGEFDFLKNRNIQAMYENSSIFVTNNQENEEDMADDIVHEIAHSVEETYKDFIYSDGELEKEFLNKRKHLYTLLKAENIDVSLSNFMEPSFDQQFDEYLHQVVGYPLLNMLGSSIFYSPYAATSLREYFANGFEAFYYFDDYDFIKRSCPKLFIKLSELMEDKQSDIEY
tara:strand:+ start:1247 stop:1936 length:690 start_codon:yes stop_codon:yes gene_type:complete